ELRGFESHVSSRRWRPRCRGASTATAATTTTCNTQAHGLAARLTNEIRRELCRNPEPFSEGAQLVVELGRAAVAAAFGAEIADTLGRPEPPDESVFRRALGEICGGRPLDGSSV